VIAFTGLLPNREWRFSSGQGPISVTLDPIIEINDAQAAIDAAEMGHGITVALSYMVHDKIKAGKLVEVLDSVAPPPQPVHLVYPKTRLIAPKIRAFVDFAAPLLKQTIDRIT
jgi:DNA-binding transcriptional LysR family regulator